MPLGPDRLIGYLDRCEVEGTCWIWTGASGGPGHARMTVDGKTRLGHRVIFTALVGPIPDGLVLDHLCGRPACLNPDHMHPCTQADHMRRHIAEHPKECPHCGRDRERTQSGTLRCLPCTREKDKERRKDPDYRAVKNAWNQKPENKAKEAARGRKRREDPEFRAKKLAAERERRKRSDVKEQRLAYQRAYRARKKAEASGAA